MADFDRLPESREYSKYNRMLNPGRAISRLDMFILKAGYHVCRYGTAPLRQIIAAGQYQFPEGLFYGGQSEAQSTQLVNKIILNSTSVSENVIHVDIHSGLGNYADYKVLLSRNRMHHDSGKYLSRLDPKKVEIIGEHRGITSPINGTISDYLSHTMQTNYVHLGLEFGTYSNLKILKSMRLENTAHHYLNENDSRRKKIKTEFQACFCPEDMGWRNRVIYDGLNVIRTFF